MGLKLIALKSHLMQAVIVSGDQITEFQITNFGCKVDKFYVQCSFLKAILLF